ncbi:flagellar basal-body rod protein FlgF [Sphingomonas swuensis]|uniref:Flagellar basal-body rod protein FlgF n=1 Tax=Sphingomonas swuensis TaxID=977800 RepID=A0ABP7SCY4_9SPHN
MDIPAYVLLSHDTALRRRMDVVANNLANVSTTGFKREQPMFEETLRRSEGTDAAARDVSFVLDFGAIHDTAEGAFTTTGNPLDLAIEGPGYLSVGLPDGSTAFTRAGNLAILEDGRIVTPAGLPVLGDNGQPVTVPPEAQGRLRIGRDGSVDGPDGPLGRLGITVFADERSVTPRGDGLFNGNGGRLLAPTETRLRSGGLEASNVQPVAETTAMIQILRAYQSSQRMGDALNDLRRTAIQRLGAFRN